MLLAICSGKRATIFTSPFAAVPALCCQSWDDSSVRTGFLGCPDGKTGVCVFPSLAVSSANVSTVALTLSDLLAVGAGVHDHTGSDIWPATFLTLGQVLADVGSVTGSRLLETALKRCGLPECIKQHQHS